MQNSATVLLHFTCSDLPDLVTIGYMTFKTSLSYPGPYVATNAIDSVTLHRNAKTKINARSAVVIIHAVLVIKL